MSDKRMVYVLEECSFFSASSGYEFIGAWFSREAAQAECDRLIGLRDERMQYEFGYVVHSVELMDAEAGVWSKVTEEQEVERDPGTALWDVKAWEEG